MTDELDKNDPNSYLTCGRCMCSYKETQSRAQDSCIVYMQHKFYIPHYISCCSILRNVSLTNPNYLSDYNISHFDFSLTDRDEPDRKILARKIKKSITAPEPLLESKSGKKEKSNKLRWGTLTPWNGMEQVMKALEFGAEKYGDHNYKEVAEEDYWNAANRHFAEIGKGNKKDNETGLDHEAHAIADLLFILENRYSKK